MDYFFEQYKHNSEICPGELGRFLARCLRSSVYFHIASNFKKQRNYKQSWDKKNISMGVHKSRTTYQLSV